MNAPRLAGAILGAVLFAGVLVGTVLIRGQHKESSHFRSPAVGCAENSAEPDSPQTKTDSGSKREESGQKLELRLPDCNAGISPVDWRTRFGLSPSDEENRQDATLKALLEESSTGSDQP